MKKKLLKKELKEAKDALAYYATQRFHEQEAIAIHLRGIEEIVIAHQSWAILQKDERECHMRVRNLLGDIHNIMGTDYTIGWDKLKDELV